MNFIKLWLIRLLGIGLILLFICIGVMIGQKEEVVDFIKAGSNFVKALMYNVEEIKDVEPGKTQEKTIIYKNEAEETEIITQSQPIFQPTLDLENKGIYLGACLINIPGKINNLVTFEDKISKPLALTHWFQAWGSNDKDFSKEMVNNLWQYGTIVVISWEPWERTTDYSQPQPRFELSKIADGDFDSYIRIWAKEIKNFKGTILIRFCHEMDGDWYPWSIGMNNNEAEDFILAWRHVHDIFQEEGATNAQWIWSPNWNSEWTDEQYNSIYPGDEYVDWIGMSIFNWGVYGPHKEWHTLDERLNWRYKKAETFNKPIIIAELSSDELGGSKAEWIKDCFNKLKNNYPKIRVAIWFNYPHARYNEKISWAVDSSPESLEAFRKAIDDPYFLGPQIKEVKAKTE